MVILNCLSTIKGENYEKKYSSLSPLCCSICMLSAEQFHVEKSVEFDEPEFGWNKLLQLKNGNTFYFHSTRKDGIELTRSTNNESKSAHTHLKVISGT